MVTMMRFFKVEPKSMLPTGNRYSGNGSTIEKPVKSPIIEKGVSRKMRKDCKRLRYG